MSKLPPCHCVTLASVLVTGCIPSHVSCATKYAYNSTGTTDATPKHKLGALQQLRSFYVALCAVWVRQLRKYVCPCVCAYRRLRASRLQCVCTRAARSCQQSQQTPLCHDSSRQWRAALSSQLITSFTALTVPSVSCKRGDKEMASRMELSRRSADRRPAVLLIVLRSLQCAVSFRSTVCVCVCVTSEHVR